MNLMGSTNRYKSLEFSDGARSRNRTGTPVKGAGF